MPKFKFLAQLATVTLAISLVAAPTSAFAEQETWVPCSEGGNFSQWIEYSYVSPWASCKGTMVVAEGIVTFGFVYGDINWLESPLVTNIVLPSTLTSVGDEAFANTQIPSIDFPGSISFFGAQVFKGSKVKTVNIGPEVTDLSAATFQNAENLEEINVDPANQKYSSDKGVLYDKEKKTLIVYPAGKKDLSYTLPASVQKIGTLAVEQQKHLTDLTIPEALKSIDTLAFFYSPGLNKLKIPKTVKLAKDALVGMGLAVPEKATTKCPKGGFLKTQGTTLTTSKACVGNITIPRYVIEIGEAAFAREWDPFTNSKISELVIPNNVTKIGANAFYGNPLTSITFSEGLKIIGDWAFSGGGEIKGARPRSVTIPSTVTHIGSQAFGKNLWINKFFFGKSVRSLGFRVLGDSSNLTNVTLKPGIREIGYEAFTGAGCRSIYVKGKFGCSRIGITNLALPNTVEVIGERAFAFSSIDSFSLPSSLKEIKKNAFMCLTNTPALVIPASVQKMNGGSFGDPLEPCRNHYTETNIYMLGNAPEVTGDISNPASGPKPKRVSKLYVSRTATGFDVDPVTKKWHGFVIAYGNPPK